ncbi:MipA/OmpV family protein [Sphingomonas soli]|uniref:MipA/OmpV family protein n=1 Tax=Sphingomonas soli TaxID=266127 RepID=UPI00082A2655|nr:MipA/OmpV family protein [Sphingomonas soli]
MIKAILSVALVSCALLSSPALAQTDNAPRTSEPVRVRVGLGAQVVPKFPGAEDMSVKPFWDFAVTRGAKPFDYEAPDESFGFPILRASGLEAGPALALESSRRRKHAGAPIDEVGTTFEAGAFVQYWLTGSFRIRAEGRKGVNGHGGITGSLSADYVVRDGDKYVVSVGPRLGLSDRTYQQAYFGVSPGASARTGLPIYRPGGGVHSVGVASGATYALDERWGLIGYVKYDRLVRDAERSPLIAAYGKRDQFSGGVGLTYTFGRIAR